MLRKDITKSVLPSTFKVASSTPGRKPQSVQFLVNIGFRISLQPLIVHSSHFAAGVIGILRYCYNLGYNKWLKANPEADIDQKLDALWLATIYVAHNDDRNDYSIVFRRVI